jgi:hypothetical protein
MYKQRHCDIFVRVTLCVVYSCRRLGVMKKPDTYVSLRFHLQPCCIIAFSCLLLVPTHHEMCNEIQERFTAASGCTYVEQCGYGNANQLITNSPWQLEQNKNIGAGQRIHVSAVSSTMYRLHMYTRNIQQDATLLS